MKSHRTNGLVLLMLTIGLCGCSDDAPPPKVVLVDAPSTRSDSALYAQSPQGDNFSIPDKKAAEFVAKFGEIYGGRGKPPLHFAIRVNPGSDGKSTTGNPQLIADYVRYFGKPLREGGVILVDESVQGAKADIVLNVYASTWQFPMTTPGGGSVVKNVPIVQVTAVRLMDGATVGQTSTTELIGDRPSAWVIVERVGVPELLKDTALTLLEDMEVRQLKAEIVDGLSPFPGSDGSVPYTSGDTTMPSGPRLVDGGPALKMLPRWFVTLIPRDDLHKYEMSLENNPKQLPALSQRTSEIRAWNTAPLPAGASTSVGDSPWPIVEALQQTMVGVSVTH